MQTSEQFILMNRDEFKEWINKQHFTREINVVQQHHTFEPRYRDFNGNNYFKMLQGMKNYHVHEAGFSDIAQNITIFPDGMIAICRPFDKAPAGIKGCNSNGICIENIGNFDIGEDIISEEHKKSILFVDAVLCMKFGLTPDINSIQYHHWWELDKGIRTNGIGEGDYKSCPGTNWFGGNSVESAQSNFIPLIINQINIINKGDEDDMVIYKTLNDIPEWGKPTIKKLIDDGTLKGVGNGDIDVSEDYVRIMVILDRKGILK